LEQRRHANRTFEIRDTGRFPHWRNDAGRRMRKERRRGCPINRYLINSPMLPGMKKNNDGSLTLFIQNKSPGKGKESNWLPAPNDTIYLIMRLYWPKTEPPSVLPAGEGTWKPPAIVATK
jgi:hypothetical protein